MRIRLDVPEKVAKEVKKSVAPLIDMIESEGWDLDYSLTARIDPGSYRDISKIVAASTRGAGTVDILDCKVQERTDTID